MDRWGRLVAGAGLCALVFVAGCKSKQEAGGGGATRGNAVTGNEIVVGEFSPLTGSTATYGMSSHNGILLAINEANAAGGVNGKQIRLVTEDDQSKPDVAATAVTKLVTQDKAVAILGEVASTRSLRAAPICQQHAVPMLSPGSTSPSLTTKGNFIFRVCFTDTFQAAVVAHFAHDQGYRTAAVFKDIRNDYSVAFGEYFTREFTRLGGKVVAEQSFQEGDTDFKAQLNSLKAVNPQCLLVPGYYSEVGTIGRQAREIGLNCPMLGGDGWDSPKLVPGAGNSLEGCWFSNHFLASQTGNPVVAKFVAAYQKAYGQVPDALGALGYDAGCLLVDAMKRTTSLDGPSIRTALASTKNFPGVTGKITIDANRNARKAALILQVKGTGFRLYKTITPEQIGQ